MTKIVNASFTNQLGLGRIANEMYSLFVGQTYKIENKWKGPYINLIFISLYCLSVLGLNKKNQVHCYSKQSKST